MLLASWTIIKKMGMPETLSRPISFKWIEMDRLSLIVKKMIITKHKAQLSTSYKNSTDSSYL